MERIETDEHNARYTPDNNRHHHLESRPGSLCCRVQGETHDDLERERAVHAITGVLTLDENDITKSHVEATIDAASINTRDAQRDAHLKSADFFDAEQFPALTFSSKAVKRTGDDELAVTGDLTIHGVTREVVFNVEGPTAPGKDPWGNTRIGLSATTKINRKDFGLTWNAALETGGILVGDDSHHHSRRSIRKSLESTPDNERGARRKLCHYVP